MKLLFITKEPKTATIAQKAGVDWIFVDLEYIGKEIRQIGRNTVISAHTIEDIKNIKKIITTSKLLVRINPIGGYSKKEIDDVISSGADIIMLPFFKTKKEVEIFLSYVNNRIETCLLVETMSSVKNIDDILTLSGINYIHIGLNDIHIERKTNFMFEFLADGYIDNIAKKIKDRKIEFGFGGMSKIGTNLKPSPERILAEHYRLGSNSIILARSFINDIGEYNDLEDFEKNFIKSVKEIRNYEKDLLLKDSSFFENNKKETKKEIYEVSQIIKNSNESTKCKL